MLNRKYALFGLIFVIFFVLFVSVGLFVGIMLFSRNGDGREVMFYRYHEFDPQTKESRMGCITLPSRMNVDYISYAEEETSSVDCSSQIMISKFGSHEYQCKGTCHCIEGDEKSSERRSSSIAISKPAYLFIAAISSFIAFNIAKNKFQNYCESQLSDSCSSTSILSEVEGCEKIEDHEDDSQTKRNQQITETTSKFTEKETKEEYVIGFITHPNLEKAKELAGELVMSRLVACVNIVPKIYSIYSWQNKIEQDEEVLMIVKTKKELVDKLIEFIKSKHPYDVPEIIFTDIKSGSTEYLKWIGTETM